MAPLQPRAPRDEQLVERLLKQRYGGRTIAEIEREVGLPRGMIRNAISRHVDGNLPKASTINEIAAAVGVVPVTLGMWFLLAAGVGRGTGYRGAMPIDEIAWLIADLPEDAQQSVVEVVRATLTTVHRGR